MNKKIKLSLLGTLIAGSTLAVTLPIVSCSAYAADVVLTHTITENIAVDTMTTYLRSANLKDQNLILSEGHIITHSAVITGLLGAVTFVEKDDATITVKSSDAIANFEVTTGSTGFAAGAAIPDVTLTVNLKDGYTTDIAITIALTGLGTAADA